MKFLAAAPYCAAWPGRYSAMPAALLALTLAILPAATPARAQTLDAPELNQTCTRVVQLMDAGGVAIPDLRAAAAPLIASTRAACGELQLRPGGSQTTYNLLTNLRAYLTLADTVPKPYPFPDAARDQLREVRDAWVRLEAHFRGLLDEKDAELRAPDRDNVSRFENENRLLPAAGARRVVFLGDSVFSQWRLNEYFPKEDFVNRAIAGQLSGQFLTRMKADVVDLKPAIVVIGAGTFDIGRGVPLLLIESNLELIADIAAENHIKVVFASVLPVSDYHKDANPTYERTPVWPPSQILALNEWIKGYCVKKKLGYVDLFAAVVDDKGMLAAEASDNGLDPNTRGYRLMAPVLGIELDKAMRAIPARSATPPAPAPAVSKPEPTPAPTAAPLETPAKSSRKK